MNSTISSSFIETLTGGPFLRVWYLRKEEVWVLLHTLLLPRPTKKQVFPIYSTLQKEKRYGPRLTRQGGSIVTVLLKTRRSVIVDIDVFRLKGLSKRLLV